MRPLHLAFARPLCLLERPTGAIHCFRNRKTFERSLVLFKGFLPRLQKSFFCLSAWRSSIIPHPRPLVNTFLHLFSFFFALTPKRQQTARKTAPQLHCSCGGKKRKSPYIQILRIFAGSARLQQPAWAAFRSGQWVPGPIHYSNCLPDSSKPQTALPPR